MNRVLRMGIAAVAILVTVQIGRADAANRGAPGATGTGLENVLIRTAKPYSDVVEAIDSVGGTVTHRYQHFDGIAARVPRSELRAVWAITGPESITKDLMVPAPAPRDAIQGKDVDGERIGDERHIPYESVRAIAAPDLPAFVAAHPEAYLVNNALTNVDALLADGFTGNGVVVAVIDSGIRPGFPHIDLDGSVIGCEDFVLDALGCSHVDNDGHGTFVAGMISANVIFGFNPAGTVFQSIATHLPGAVILPNGVPMVGSAPLSSIYALRVFPPGQGSPTSRILAALDRAMELRDLWEAGDPAGVKIQVVNMSLGGPTVFAGRDLFDTAVDAALDHDIVVVDSAGNAGPSGLTIGSPGSSLGSITTGAASIAGYERIVRDLQFGLGVGFLYRASDHIQTAVFSSRGPNADGRGDPDVLANGDWSFGQGFFSIGNISWAGGTSFSSPTVAGVAAILREAEPSATARQVRNAIINSANPSLLGDGSTAQDQGSGFVDAQAARTMLGGGGVPDALPAPPAFTKSVKVNVETNAGLDVRNGFVTEHIGSLLPGERGEIYYRVNPNTAQVVFSIADTVPELPPGQQNVFFGDDVLLTIHSAKTSRHPGDGDYIFQGFITGGGTLVINDPETGIMRFTVNGDWTNAGRVDTDVAIFSVSDPIPGSTQKGKIAALDLVVVPFEVAADTALAEFRLGWREDWGNYPLNDIDLILVDPVGGLNFDGATLRNPELAFVLDPMPGAWLALVSGFEVHTGDDKYELRISLDGNLVH
jgi:subtilisin family serine protease